MAEFGLQGCHLPGLTGLTGISGFISDPSFKLDIKHDLKEHSFNANSDAPKTFILAIQEKDTMSSDVLTQLQTCYDQLLTQFFSTVSYLSLRHPLIAPDPIPGEPYTQVPKDDKPPERSSTRHRYTNMAVGPEDTAAGFQPLPPETFEHAQEELAEDLILKGQQIEQLIRSLPGLGRGEEQQAREIQELVVKVREMEKLRKQKRKELRAAVRQLDDVILGMATSINADSEQALPLRNGTTNGT